MIIAALIPSGLALLHRVNSSTLISTLVYSKAKGEGFTKAIIHGYQEACSSGGHVNPNFIQTYKNVCAAGYTNIDTYWFPCNGLGNSCKSYAQQIAVIGQTFNVNSMKIGHIWIDIEKDSICNPWNYGMSSNLVQAKALILVARASGFVFGIYSSPGEWASIFGSDSIKLATDLPLWFTTFDNVQTLHMPTSFGGWTTAFGKQYTDVSASGQFDLSVFSA